MTTGGKFGVTAALSHFTSLPSTSRSCQWISLPPWILMIQPVLSQCWFLWLPQSLCPFPFQRLWRNPMGTESNKGMRWQSGLNQMHLVGTVRLRTACQHLASRWIFMTLVVLQRLRPQQPAGIHSSPMVAWAKICPTCRGAWMTTRTQ